jgi:hypothetical protein
VTELERAQRYAMQQERNARRMATCIRAIWTEAWLNIPKESTDTWLNRVAKAVREAKVALDEYEKDMAEYVGQGAR